MAFALLMGFAPAVLLGVPGLVALAAAIVAAMMLMAFLKYGKVRTSDGTFDLVQLVTEACFYLGALASWSYV
jgi:hypothetical protein